MEKTSGCFVDWRQIWPKAALAGLFALAVFLSAYKLTESPPTWMDEGIIINTARVLAETGNVGIRIAPGAIASAGIVTTSYPVTAPIAVVFKLFGEGLLQARMVMAAYLLLLFIMVWALINGYILPETAEPVPRVRPLSLLAFALVVTFAPIYGDGKNVLGEIPGMFFFLSFLLMAYSIGRAGKAETWKWVIMGMTAGLFMATKPIFILFFPAMAGAAIAYHLQKRVCHDAADGYTGSSVVLPWRPLAIAVVSCAVPLVIWMLVQFSGDSLSGILGVYANPDKLPLFATILGNMKIFLTQSQPLYFLFLFGIWTAASLIRLKRRNPVPFPELVAYAFSLLVFAAFFRLTPYFRYFFPAELVAIVYLPSSLSVLARSVSARKHRKILRLAFLYGLPVMLVFFQAYSLFKTSWVAQYYSSAQSAELSAYFKPAAGTSFFLYQVPEIATFIPTDDYYQFFYAAPGLPVGSSSLSYLAAGAPDKVVMNGGQTGIAPYLLARYARSGEVARYDVWTRK